MTETKKYQLSKAMAYIRKAKKILEDLHIDNDKIEGDFRSIYEYCWNFITKDKLISKFNAEEYENRYTSNN
jgi:hypothetical protein